MRRCQYTVTRATVHAHAVGLVLGHLRLADFSPRCSARRLLTILFAAAARLSSVFDTCQNLLRAPSDETVRQALLATLPSYAELQRRLNRALAGDLPRALRRRRQPLACDLTLIPYHGQPHREAHEVYRSKPKSGTSHFHAYATAYVVRQGRRFTVALTPVRRGEALDAVLRRLLRQAARAGIRPRLLLLDRGFYTVKVIRYLQAARYPFLMPAVVRRQRPRGPAAAADVRWRPTSGWGRHTLRNAAGRVATVGICVACRNYRGQRRRHGRQRLVYAYWGLQPSSYQWVRQTYRLRFGIETTYRQLRQARIRTTTRNPLLRLLYVGLALVLRNVWVWCHAHLLATPRRGGRRPNPERLRFQVLLLWLLPVAEETLGLCDFTDAECPLDSRG